MTTTRPFIPSSQYGWDDVDCRKFRARGNDQKERLSNVREDKQGPFMLITDHIERMRTEKDEQARLRGQVFRLEDDLQALYKRDSMPGLTDLEAEIMRALMAVWIKFQRLPDEHIEQHDEFRQAIHRCQDYIAARPVYRFLNKKQESGHEG